MAVDVEQLRRTLPGNVTGPGDQGWAEARRPWNLAFDQHPALVVAAGVPAPRPARAGGR